MNTESNLYEVLGVSPDVDTAGIRQAFRRMALRHHPDRNPGDQLLAAERFRIVQHAYELLMDPERRRIYDQQLEGTQPLYHELAKPYLHVEIEEFEIPLNHELEVRFSFPSDGRFFKRASMTDWALCEGPTFSHRTNTGTGVRETILHFRLAPLRTGRIIIPPAQIYFDHKPYFSEPIAVDVMPTDCLFCKGQTAGDKPLRVFLHKEFVTSNSAYRKTVVRERLVLLPRSALATFYHKVGEILLVALPFIGTAWALVHHFSFFTAMIISMLIAFLNYRLMFFLMKIKPPSALKYSHERVKELLQAGYKKGRR